MATLLSTSQTPGGTASAPRTTTMNSGGAARVANHPERHSPQSENQSFCEDCHKRVQACQTTGKRADASVKKATLQVASIILCTSGERLLLQPQKLREPLHALSKCPNVPPSTLQWVVSYRGNPNSVRVVTGSSGIPKTSTLDPPFWFTTSGFFSGGCGHIQHAQKPRIPRFRCPSSSARSLATSSSSSCKAACESAKQARSASNLSLSSRSSSSSLRSLSNVLCASPFFLSMACSARDISLRKVSLNSSRESSMTPGVCGCEGIRLEGQSTGATLKR
mmetsp:Transcript_25641/g.51724  ORF Transcript_25641/g.51724 Transcript_25641/m.51724 type:complete len:278 (+) Transcript_25641:39-872(+)